MEFWPAVNVCFSKYGTFQGRAPRSEYWYFYLFYWIVASSAVFLDLILFLDPDFTPATSIWVIGTFLPSLAVAARRLHDIDRTAWWLLLLFLPFVGWFILVVLACIKGTTSSNRFGADTSSPNEAA